MVGCDMTLVAEEQMYFIPRDLRAQRWIVDQQAVERFRGRSSCQHYVEGAFLAHRRSLNELLRCAFGDCCAVLEDSNLTLHAHSTQVMIPVLSGAAIRPRLSTSSSPMRRHERPSRSSKSSASIGPH